MEGVETAASSETAAAFNSAPIHSAHFLSAHFHSAHFHSAHFQPATFHTVLPALRVVKESALVGETGASSAAAVAAAQLACEHAQFTLFVPRPQSSNCQSSPGLYSRLDID